MIISSLKTLLSEKIIRAGTNEWPALSLKVLSLIPY